MKKIIALGIAILLLLCTTSASIADTDIESIDISSLSFKELLDLQQKINLALWNCEEYQEVKVPQGVYLIGEDIPAGYWHIEAVPSVHAYIAVGNLPKGKNSIPLSEMLFNANIYGPESEKYVEDETVPYIEVELVEGYYIEIDKGSVIFKTYTGRPFSFK